MNDAQRRFPLRWSTAPAGDELNRVGLPDDDEYFS
jgi:hypothetical protein